MFLKDFFFAAAPLLYAAPVVAHVSSFFTGCDAPPAAGSSSAEQEHSDIDYINKSWCLRHVRTLHLVYRPLPADRPEHEIPLGPAEKAAATAEVDDAQACSQMLYQAERAGSVLPRLARVTVGRWGDRGWAWREERLNRPGDEPWVPAALRQATRPLPTFLHSLATVEDWEQHISAGPLALPAGSTLMRTTSTPLAQFTTTIADLELLPPISLGSRNVVLIQPMTASGHIEVEQYIIKFVRHLCTLFAGYEALLRFLPVQQFVGQASVELQIDLLHNNEDKRAADDNFEKSGEVSVALQRKIDGIVAEAWKGRVWVRGFEYGLMAV
jgi:hypothetical protein